MLQNDIYFYNWTIEDFEWKLDGRPYTFKAGSVTPMTKSEFDHFAKHLTDRELCKAGLQTNNQLKREEYLQKCVGVASEPQMAPTPEPPAPDIKTADIGQVTTTEKVPEFEGLKEDKPKVWCDSCDAKGPIKHKKNCPKAKK